MVYHQIPIIIVRSWLVNPYYDDETFTHDAPSTSSNAVDHESNLTGCANPLKAPWEFLLSDIKF